MRDIILRAIGVLAEIERLAAIRDVFPNSPDGLLLKRVNDAKHELAKLSQELADGDLIVRSDDSEPGILMEEGADAHRIFTSYARLEDALQSGEIQEGDRVMVLGTEMVARGEVHRPPNVPDDSGEVIRPPQYFDRKPRLFDGRSASEHADHDGWRHVLTYGSSYLVQNIHTGILDWVPADQTGIRS